MRVRRAVGPSWPKIQARVAKKALLKGMNRSSATIRTRAGREVAKEMGVKVRDVREATDLKRARRSDLTATITARGRPFNLIRFRARQSKRGAPGVRAKPWGQARFFPGMWIGNNGRTVFVRTKRQGRNVRSAYGPGVANTFTKKVRTRAFRKLFADRFKIEFGRAYEFELSKAEAKAG